MSHTAEDVHAASDTFVDVETAGRLPLAVGRLLGRATGVRPVDMALYHLNRRVARRWPAGALAQTRLGGVQALVPVDDLSLCLCMTCGHYEPDVERIAAALLRPGDTAVDVGANIGLHAMRFARAVGAGGRVIAFEPGPLQRSILERSLALNGSALPVVVVPKAVGREQGTLELYEAEGVGLMSSLRRTAVHEQAVLRPVTVTTLDAELLPLLTAPPRLLKVDVEGFECEVLEGARDLLARFPPEHMILELSWMTDNRALLALTADAGYVPVRLRLGRLVPRPVDDAELARLAVRPGCVNVLFARRAQ